MNLIERVIEIEKDRYKSSGDYSVTELIDPPRIVQLKKRHKDKIVPELRAIMPSLIGTAIHKYFIEECLLKWKQRHQYAELKLEEEFSYDFMYDDSVMETRKVSGRIDTLDKTIINDLKTAKCFSEDTEILTEFGWKRFPNLSSRDKVAQYFKDGTINFTKPTDIIKKNYRGKMIHLYTQRGHYDQLVTPDHRIIYRKHKLSDSGKISEKEAKDILPNGRMKFDRSGIKVSGWEVLNFWERFLIAYQADGSKWRSDKNCNGQRCGHKTVDFVFSNERKIERLKWILNNLPFLSYKIYDRPRKKYNNEKDQKRFSVRIPNTLIPRKLFSWVKLKMVSYVWCQEFINELSYWDSYIDHNTINYSSKYKYNCDIIQAICSIGGYACFYTRQKTTHKDSHKLHIRKNQIDGQSIKKEEIDYNGMVYCVSVPTGMIVVRRNNQPCISGNCWKKIFDPEFEHWTMQQNFYALLALKNRVEITKIMVSVVYLDWIETNALRDKDYPQHQQVDYILDFWPFGYTEKKLRERLALHVDAEKIEDDDLPACTRDERWERFPGGHTVEYAIMKSKLAKRAARVIKTSLEDAIDFSKSMKGITSDSYIEVRYAQRKRCEKYCPVNQFCNHYHEYMKRKENDSLNDYIPLGV